MVGECRLGCKVFMFEKLGCNFLLGGATIHEHGLVLDGHLGLLYVGAKGPDSGIQLTFCTPDSTAERSSADADVDALVLARAGCVTCGGTGWLDGEVCYPTCHVRQR